MKLMVFWEARRYLLIVNQKRKGGDMKTREFIKADENLKIESEKRYQRPLQKMRRPQVEKLTLLKEEKKPKQTGRK